MMKNSSQDKWLESASYIEILKEDIHQVVDLSDCFREKFFLFSINKDKTLLFNAVWKL